MTRSHRRPALAGAGVAVVVGLIAWLAPGVGGSHGTPPREERLLAGALATTGRLSPSAAAAALNRLSDAPLPAADTPSCPDPLTPPAAQFPNGAHGLGIPFVAALSSGEILSGYRSDWLTPSTKANPHPSYPWALTLRGISGWVTGLLEVPSLTAQVDQTTGIAFCDDRGLAFTTASGQPCGTTGACDTLPHPPHLQYSLVTSNKASTTTQNYLLPVKGQHAVGSYAPDFFALNAVGPPALSVKGVDASGALELAGETKADATVSIFQNTASNSHQTPHYTKQQVCNSFHGQTTIGIGTTAPPQPAGGPPQATLQFSPHPLLGAFPHAGSSNPASAGLVGDDFPVAAFDDAPGQTPPCFYGVVLNDELSGFSAPSAPGQAGLPRDQCIPTSLSGAPCPLVASQPGWSQITITATIASLGLPYSTTVPGAFGFTS